jgi:hypothetical protein
MPSMEKSFRQRIQNDDSHGFLPNDDNITPVLNPYFNEAFGQNEIGLVPLDESEICADAACC